MLCDYEHFNFGYKFTTVGTEFITWVSVYLYPVSINDFCQQLSYYLVPPGLVLSWKSLADCDKANATIESFAALPLAPSWRAFSFNRNALLNIEFSSSTAVLTPLERAVCSSTFILYVH